MRAIGYLVLCIFAFLQLSGAGALPRIYHIPPKTLIQNKPVELTCVVEPGDCHLKNVKIFLRTDPAALYKEFTMQYRDGLWVLPLIPEMLRGQSLDYFITAEFSDYVAVAFPSENPSGKPVRVQIVIPKTNKSKS
jgi:hypothetical protein